MTRRRPKITVEKKPCKRGCGKVIIVVTNHDIPELSRHGSCQDCYTKEEIEEINHASNWLKGWDN